MLDLLPDTGLGQGLTVAIVVVDVLLRIAAVAVVPYNRRPPAAMAWLLLIMVQPMLGWIIFATLGHNRLPRGRRRKMRALQGVIGEVTRDIPDEEDPERSVEWLPGVLQMLRAQTSLPHLGGNACVVHDEFDDQVASMVRAIDGAERYVHVEFYLIVASERTEPFFAALERARGRDVDVRVLVDHVTSVRYPRRKETVDRLEAMGAQWQDMLPLRPLRGQWQRPDLRNHRKLLVVDGDVGFMGSLNLVDPTYLWTKNVKRGLEWKDTWLEVRGPVVREIDVLFLADWWAETNELVDQGQGDPGRPGEVEASVVPSGPGFEGENNLRLFLECIHAAVDRITIVSPYFVPDDAMSYAITSAAMRGVRVELFASAIGDQFWTFHAQRSYYESLLRAGVRIWLYREPIVLHSKFMVFDGQHSIFGSSNIDMRSFGLNFEISMLLEGPEMAERLREVAERYRHASSELTLEAWLERPRIGQIFDNVARLTSALQ
ncbi:cardiolipin synthase [Agrococcus versicolor]|uniref:Cardiolipin synthase n=1 Tax=Agrococcus versicolor TaxID=501482 RepID=A0ABP5ML98_9MICO